MHPSLLQNISQPRDLKRLSSAQIQQLCGEIRQFLLDSVSKTGGHLASNLGAVELTVALHRIFETPRDAFVFDVGHQCYTHKLLTGRYKRFGTLRQLDGLSGFPNPNESVHDAFIAGHGNTALSVAIGIAWAKKLKGEPGHVVAIIGDGAFTGGMVYEGMNNIGKLDNLMVILNDNKMSISENVGGISQYLSGFRTADAYRDFKNNVMNSLNHIPIYGERMVKHIRNTKSSIKQLFIPGMFFEEMGIIYLGPVDGSDIKEMCRVFDEAKRVDGPVLVHVLTKKGAGYGPAERYPSRFHGAEPFVIETGLPKNKRTKANYTDVFSTVMKKLGERNPKVVAITAAMAEGTGLRRFHRNFPDRFFDVGIAEAHATTFAAGLAKSGLIPVFAVYSSFLQRAFDQILHDVCIQNLHVIFAIDRAGLVGSDGETHQGIFDISYLSVIPNMTIMAPKNKWELSDMMKFAVAYDGPIALRYPRGAAYDGLKEIRQPIELAKSELIRKGSTVAIMALGSMVKTAVDVVKLLEAEGISATLINARFAMPFDKEAIKELPAEHSLLVTMEENVQSGGFGEHVTEYVKTNGIVLEVLTVALPDCYVEHGNVEVLKKELHVDAESVAKRIIAVL